MRKLKTYVAVKESPMGSPQQTRGPSSLPPRPCQRLEEPSLEAISSLNDNVAVDTSSPLNITRAVKQYMYEANNVEYLDCVNSSAHVGHSHPQVVCKGQQQMTKLVTAQSFVSDNLKHYVKSLVESLPESLSVCFLTNSGCEANNLAVRLARRYTGAQDVIVVEDAYHGNIGTMLAISPSLHSKVQGYKKEEWVHVTALPDSYRGAYRYDDEDASVKYAAEVETLLESVKASGRRVAAFIAEPYFVRPGVHPPAPQFFHRVYGAVRAHGGLVIADEVETGLGRTGQHMWGFLSFGVVPDIVTVGKSLGNGHPMGAVICSREVSERLGGYFSTFGGNPVSCAIGLAVLEVITNEKLVSSAKMVGRSMQTQLRILVDKYEILGDVRGSGLLWALEIVGSKADPIPEPELAREVMYRLKGRQVLVSITGRNKNVLLFTPPMCFTMENSRVFTKCLDDVLGTFPNPPTLRSENLPSSSTPEVCSVTSVIVANTLSMKRKLEEELGRGEGKRNRGEEGPGYQDMD